MRIFLRFGVAGLLVVTNSKIMISFVLFVLLRRASVGEMNFSQDFIDEGSGIASVTEFLPKVSFVLIKVLLDWVGS